MDIPNGRIARLLPILGLLLCTSAPRAAPTDISSSPLVTSSTAAVLPNLQFILDDSGSMLFDYLPDYVSDYNLYTGDASGSTQNMCRASDGGYDVNCCRNSNGDQRGVSACFYDQDSESTSSSPFGSWRAHPPFMSNEFNAVYYNPAILYTPPKKADGSSYASQTDPAAVKQDAYGIQGTRTINLNTQFPDIAWCAGFDCSTDCLRNGNYNLPGVVNGKAYTRFCPVTASGSGKRVDGPLDSPVISTVNFGPYYYRIEAGEYCTTADLQSCSVQTVASTSYPYAAPVRWCNSAANAAAAVPASGSCEAVYTSSYRYARYPGKFYVPGSAAIPGVAAQAAVPATASFTLTLTNCSSIKGRARITAIQVNGGANLLTAATPYETAATTLAADVINLFQSSAYIAGRSSATVTLTQTVASNQTDIVTVTRNTAAGSSSNQCTISLTPATPRFSGYVAAVAAVAPVPAVAALYPGRFVRTDIIASVSSYLKAATRTDCAGTTCSYSEEISNFSNWWTYYRTRMQMAKSSASLAFSPIDDKYRVGYAQLNSDPAALNVATYNSTQKTAWYAKLLAASPSGGTPLQRALSRAGRTFAGKRGSVVGGADPVQYSCQQNFAILTTDGYWNGTPEAKKIDGTTDVGDADGSLSPPMLGSGTSNTLADIAAYYYNTDIRSSDYANCSGALGAGVDVCPNIVPVTAQDAASNQHMTTFTVGLGIPGFMQYTADYEAATSGDYYSVKNQTAANPAAGVCSWQSTGACIWPTPSADSQANIDDLWHAAVNGHGRYYSAGNPAALRSGLADALSGIAVRTGASAAATASNPNVVSGDNFIFSSTFESVNWTGELTRQTIDIGTGAVSSSFDWHARDALDSNSARTIYLFDGSASAAASKLRSFSWSLLGATEQAYFLSPAIDSLTQLCTSGSNCLSGSVRTAAGGSNLVEYLRGDRSLEGDIFDGSMPFRSREHLLGDIVDSEPVYVKKPIFSYADAGYDSFKSGNAARTATVYVAANDGMLHAFSADTGTELWAYIPTALLPRLYKLADKNYSTRHEYFADGTPIVGDVYFGGAWHTILVAGLNAGGRSYYALDITDPASPKALWEFTDTNLGLSFGKPEITKLKDGSWVVLATSGYNNLSPGDGKGYLFVLNAATGAKIREIGTGVGTTTTPSGLAQIRAWSDNGEYDNTSQRVYGGDLYGKLWRFDINGDVGASGYDAQLLATLSKDAVAQPITSRPQLGNVGGYAMVYIGTGSYLGASDLSNVSVQSLYAIKDTLGSTSYASTRDANFVQQTLVSGSCPSGSAICSAGQPIRTNSDLSVNLAIKNGWYIDLPASGERSTTDADLQLGTLALTTNIPNSDACSVGGSSYINFFDYRNGGSVTTAGGVSSVQIGSAISTRPVLVKLPNNKVLSLVRLSDGTTVVAPTPVASIAGTTRRLSWRQLGTQ
ncbi:MAG: hypothetical protein JWQ90_4060 [Hydrocarboniphaga sp.]|uniref:pilus assembly protein n=1 Tax=Hydrocarboniphaga sp. TaxID=2033016 RepID=UPI0026389F12|nr:PilC/PilY family type IV pilus protein [Hydrocarboniphaga sp.]MDB5971610.1 hypothetical protein [Hydrocarboniphaga sp.]